MTSKPKPKHLVYYEFTFEGGVCDLVSVGLSRSVEGEGVDWAGEQGGVVCRL